MHICQPRKERVSDICLNASGDTIVAFFEGSAMIDVYGPDLVSAYIFVCRL